MRRKTYTQAAFNSAHFASILAQAKCEADVTCKGVSFEIANYQTGSIWRCETYSVANGGDGRGQKMCLSKKDD